MSQTFTEENKKILKRALNALGKKNLTLIAHGGSFPAMPNNDYGFGTYNSRAGKELIKLISGLFDSIQLGPAGKTGKGHPSPYTSTIFSLNTLFIDLEQLTTDEWNKILSVETYRRICDENPNKGTNMGNYDYAYDKHEEAMREAFSNFDFNNKEYLDFVKENKTWLERDSIYEIVVNEYKKPWAEWSSELDRKLFCPDPSGEFSKEKCKKRIEEIVKNNKEEIDFYYFGQFVIWKQNNETKKFASKYGIKMIADRQVAFSDRDIWANQDLFLQDWFLGCPPDQFAEDGQAWGFPMLDPEKIFNKNGSLGKAGKLIKELYKKMFTENPGGVRIDHVVGLIDPWVYKKGCTPKPEEGAGRLYSSPEHPELGKYAIATTDDIEYRVPADSEFRVKKLNQEQIDKYARFMKKLIIDTAVECGLTKDEIICEDLGSQTYPVESVMEQYELNGMRLIQFSDPHKEKSKYRSSNVPANAWIMAGTHDSVPICMWAEDLVNTHEGYLHALNLMEDVYPNIYGRERDDTIVRLTTDSKFLADTKMAELFTSKAKNVQIFFADLWGIHEVYNLPGSPEAGNWKLRIPSNFEEELNNSKKYGYGFNFVPALITAMQARGEQFVKEHISIMNELLTIDA